LGGTPLSGAPMTRQIPPLPKPPRSKSKFPWFLLLFVGCFFGVFRQHESHSISSVLSPTPAAPSSLVQSLPSDALAAIQPAEDARWDGGDIGLNIYNGSQWTVCYVDLEIQVRSGFHTVRQTYRASVNTSPLQPLSSEYVTVHTALLKSYQGTTMSYRVIGAMGIHPR
jgi:hypothetical protein